MGRQESELHNQISKTWFFVMQHLKKHGVSKNMVA